MQQVKQQGEGQVIGLYYNKDGSKCDSIKPIYKSYFKDVDEVVIDYNGDITKIKIQGMDNYYQVLRFAIYRSEPRTNDDYIKCIQNVVGTIQDNIERAMVAHNFLLYCDISSVFRVGLIEKDGEVLIHAYSLISLDGQNHIFDSFYPFANQCWPVVSNITPEHYNRIINLDDANIDVMVSHNSELYHEPFNVIYYGNGSKPINEIKHYGKGVRETV